MSSGADMPSFLWLQHSGEESHAGTISSTTN